MTEERGTTGFLVFDGNRTGRSIGEELGSGNKGAAAHCIEFRRGDVEL